MPDQRTVFMTDDGDNVGWYKFVADAAGDLSSGRLYAANGGSFTISWVFLGAGALCGGAAGARGGGEGGRERHALAATSAPPLTLRCRLPGGAAGPGRDPDLCRHL